MTQNLFLASRQTKDLDLREGEYFWSLKDPTQITQVARDSQILLSGDLVCHYYSLKISLPVHSQAVALLIVLVSWDPAR